MAKRKQIESVENEKEHKAQVVTHYVLSADGDGIIGEMQIDANGSGFLDLYDDGELFSHAVVTNRMEGRR